MSGNGHRTAAEIRSHLDHPVIDGDGHWVEFDTDFAIIYPTAGLRVPRIGDDATRRAVVRAHNVVTADYFRSLSDRMTPAAIIPMHTPDEAIEELEFVTKQLGSKVGMFGSG